VQLKTNYIVSGRHLTFAKVNIENLLYVSVGGVVGGFICRDAIGAISGVIVGTFVGLVVLFCRQMEELGNPSFVFDKLKKLIGFGLPLMLTSLSYWFVVLGNRLLISHFLGLKALGQYAVVMAIPGMITVIYTSLSTILLSSLSSLYARSHFDEISHWLKNIYELYAVLSISLSCAGFIGCEQIVRLVSSDHYLFEGMKWVFLAGGLNSVFNGLLSIALRQYDLEVLPWFSMLNSIIVMSISVVSSLILIPMVGMIGCLIGNILAFCVGLIVIKNHNFRNLRPTVSDMRIILFLCLSLVFSFAIDELIHQNLITRSMFAILVFGAIVVAGSAFNLLNLTRLVRQA